MALGEGGVGGEEERVWVDHPCTLAEVSSTLREPTIYFLPSYVHKRKNFSVFAVGHFNMWKSWEIEAPQIMNRQPTSPAELLPYFKYLSSSLCKTGICLYWAWREDFTNNLLWRVSTCSWDIKTTYKQAHLQNRLLSVEFIPSPPSAYITATAKQLPHSIFQYVCELTNDLKNHEALK